MGLALVDRGVRALSDQLNAYYRVFKGTDPDSIALRLNPGGSVEIRHSSTNAAVFHVDDNGATGTITPADGSVTLAKLAPNSVDSSKIVNGSIMDADINGAAGINGGKVATGTISGGASGQIASETIDSSNIKNGSIVDADVAAAGTANLALGKLAPGAAGLVRSNGSAISAGNQLAAADVPAGLVTSAMIADGTIADADVSATAGIAVTKLAHVGANNVLKSTGSANVGGQVANADVAPAAAIAYSKLALAASIVNADIAAAAAIAYSKLALAASIVNADIATAAAIALSKLAPGASGVLKSNGTVITAGNLIVTADMAISTINGDRISDGTISSTKLQSGGGVPANSITTTEIADGTIQAVDIAQGVVPRVLFQRVTLGAPAAVMDSVQIPTTYKNLIVKVFARSAQAVANDNVRLQLSSNTTGTPTPDTGADYGYQVLVGQNAAAAAGYTAAQTSLYAGIIPGASATANLFGMAEASIPNAMGATVKAVTIVSSAMTDPNSGATNYVYFIGGGWWTTAQVRQVRAIVGSGANFVAGSILEVWGEF